MSVDLENLIQQAQTDPHAVEVLTDYFEEQGLKKPRLSRPSVILMVWGRRFLFDHGIFIDHVSELIHSGGVPLEIGYQVYRSGQPSRLLGQTKTLAAAKKIAHRAVLLDPLAWQETTQRKKYKKRRVW